MCRGTTCVRESGSYGRLRVAARAELSRHLPPRTAVIAAVQLTAGSGNLRSRRAGLHLTLASACRAVQMGGRRLHTARCTLRQSETPC